MVALRKFAVTLQVTNELLEMSYKTTVYSVKVAVPCYLIPF